MLIGRNECFFKKNLGMHIYSSCREDAKRAMLAPVLMMQMADAVRRVVRFYAEGFRSMTLGRTLWTLILLKLAVIFGAVRLFFMPPALVGSEEQMAEGVSAELIQRAENR